MEHDLKRGDRIWLQGEKRSFYVRALNERFVVCTRPNQNTPQLAEVCVLDLELQTRNKVFNLMKSDVQEHSQEILNNRITGQDGTPKRFALPLGKIDCSNYNRLTGR